MHARPWEGLLGRPKQKRGRSRWPGHKPPGPRGHVRDAGARGGAGSHEQRRGNRGCAQQDASDGPTGTGEGGAGIRAEVTALVQGQMMGPRGLRGEGLGAAAGALQRHKPQGSLIRTGECREGWVQAHRPRAPGLGGSVYTRCVPAQKGTHPAAWSLGQTPLPMPFPAAQVSTAGALLSSRSRSF